MTMMIFKLVSGEEILADVINQTGEIVQLKNPVMLVVVAEGQLGMIPWLPLAEKPEITIKMRDVMFSYVPKQDLVNHYKQRTGGIVTANPQVLKQLDSWHKE